MQKIFLLEKKKVWCNTDKINEQKKKKVQKKIAQTYVN